MNKILHKKKKYLKVLISGHDTCIVANLLIYIKALNLNETEIYRLPKYYSQLALEVKTEKNEEKTTSCNDYNVIRYFDDAQICNIPAEKL